MRSFAERFGELTVEQAQELNEAARWYCGHEVTSCEDNTKCNDKKGEKMKLKNKETGEIGEVKWDGQYKAIAVETDIHYYCYSSVDELSAEWKDYEDPKEYWYIDADGEPLCEPSDDRCGFDNNCREIGNYFETREEAEKAVEKLKAWKRLKDKGYRVMMNNHVDGMLYLRIWNDTTDAPTPINKAGEIYKDLDLLFGGEE